MNKCFGVVFGLLLAVTWVTPASAHLGHGGATSETVTAVFGAVVALGITFAIRSIGHARLSLVQYLVVVLTLFTALIHLLLGARLLDLIDGLLLLSGAAYLLVLGALFIPLRQLAGLHRQAAWAMVGLALVNIVAFFVVHPWGVAGAGYEWLGLGTKLVELALIGAVLIESRVWQSQSSRPAQPAPLAQTQVKQ